MLSHVTCIPQPIRVQARAINLDNHRLADSLHKAKSGMRVYEDEATHSVHLLTAVLPTPVAPKPKKRGRPLIKRKTPEPSVQTMLFQWGMREYLVEVSGARLAASKRLCVYVPLTKVGRLESPESTVKMRVAEDVLQYSPLCVYIACAFPLPFHTILYYIERVLACGECVTTIVLATDALWTTYRKAYRTICVCTCTLTFMYAILSLYTYAYAHLSVYIYIYIYIYVPQRGAKGACLHRGVGGRNAGTRKASSPSRNSSPRCSK